MKKLVTLILAISLSSVLLFSSVASATAAECAFGTRGQCGAAVGCSGTTPLCAYEFWDGDSKCRPDPDKRCKNTDHSQYVCGVTLYSTNWCGSSGGCQVGYMCDEDTWACVKSAGCDNLSKEGEQCYKSGGKTKCGAEGYCKTGFRCAKVSPTVSRTGWACVDVPDKENQYCPGSASLAQPAETVICEQTTSNPNAICNCASGTTRTAVESLGQPNQYCCGHVAAGSCWASVAEYQASLNAGSEPDPVDSPGGGGSTPIVPPPASSNTGVDTTPDGFNIFDNNPTSQDFQDLNPLEIAGTPEITERYFNSPGGIISRILLFAFPIAGLILFVMLSWAGFEIVMNAPSGKSVDAGKQRATSAIIGFIILFCSYWIMQAVELVFGIVVL